MLNPMGHFNECPHFKAEGSVWEKAVQTLHRIKKSQTCNTWISVSVLLLCILCVLPVSALGDEISHQHVPCTKFFEFTVEQVNKTRNCVDKGLVLVNGQYPGPTIYINEGDRVVVNVINQAYTNLTIHWHGIQQRLSSWQDGVGYITQCSIQHGDYFVYNFTVTGQRGTTFWHAHVNWLRATVHGAFITKPTNGYPFPMPYQELPVILGEWWDGDVEAIEAAGLAAGGAFPLADALTINGFPGFSYNCSESEGLAVLEVTPGKTYLLRIINAALNSEMFFSIANHVLTVVEADSEYVKPFQVEKGIYIAAGQTMNVLVTANQSPGTYHIAARAHSSLLITDLAGIPPQALPFVLNDVQRIPTTALFQYDNVPVTEDFSAENFSFIPAYNDTLYRTAFEDSLKTLHPERVPKDDNLRNLLFTVGTGTQPCTPERPCSPQQGAYRVVGQVSNQTFVLPTIAILQAFFYGIPGVYTPDFPDFPLNGPYDYTNATSPSNPGQVSTLGTRVVLVEYGTTIQLVLQDMNNFAFETHPFHLHGHFFHVMGRGYGNFDPLKDPAKFNNYDPPSRFTADIQQRGWVAIRFKATNPGAWLLHCHLDKHTVWGMQTAFLTKNGVGPEQTLPPPPPRLTQC